MKVYFNKKLMKFQICKLMKCMDYVFDKANKKKPKNFRMYYDLYHFLGGYAWGYLCDHCEHEIKINKKHPKGRCTICGKVFYAKENHSRKSQKKQASIVSEAYRTTP